MRAAVDVWQASLRAGDAQLAAMRALLTPAELDRAGSLRTPTLACRFVAARAFTRAVVAGHLGIDATGLTFAHGPAGKPFVPGTGLEFNVSHAGDYALCAITDAVPVGVDLERIDLDVDVDEVAAHCFAAPEVDALRALSPHARTRAFFATWTRKEAVAKALGSGLSTPLSSFAVSVDPDAPPRLTRQVETGGPWTLYALDAPRGYVACLAARAAALRVRPRVWTVSSRAVAAVA